MRRRAAPGLFVLAFALISVLPSHPQWAYAVIPGRWRHLFYLALAAVLASALLDSEVRRRQFASSDWPLWILLLTFSASLLAAQDRDLAWQAYIHVSAPLVLLYFIGKGLFLDRRWRRAVIWTVTLMGGAVALYGIFEVILGMNLLYDFIPESPFYERYRRVHRPLSTQFNPAALATYLQFAAPFAFYVTRTTQGWLRAVAGTAVALDLTCLLLTFSRGGFLGLAGALCFWLVIRKRFRALALSVLAVAAVIAAAPRLPGSAFRLSAGWTVYGSTGVLSEFRRERIETALAMCRDHPMFGVGFQNYRSRFDEYYPDRDTLAMLRKLERERNRRIVKTNTANMYVTLLAETGLIGSAAFVLFVATLLVRSLATWRRCGPARREVLGVTAASLVGLLLNFIGYSALYWLAPLSLFGLQCGFLSGLVAGARRQPPAPV